MRPMRTLCTKNSSLSCAPSRASLVTKYCWCTVIYCDATFCCCTLPRPDKRSFNGSIDLDQDGRLRTGSPMPSSLVPALLPRRLFLRRRHARLTTLPMCIFIVTKSRFLNCYKLHLAGPLRARHLLPHRARNLFPLCSPLWNPM
jgi:hypothetical protein